MATPKVLARLDRLIWILIFVGLLTLALGLATHSEHVVAGWSLTAVGAMAAAAGVVLIWVRSRMPDSAIDEQNQGQGNLK